MTPFQEFLTQLAEALDFSYLQPDEWGACMIVLKEHEASLLFELDEQLVPNTILLSSPLCPLPYENRIELLEESLKGNLVIEETLSCKPDEDILYLHRRIHPHILAPELKLLIADFLTHLATWRKKLETLAKSPAKPYRYPLSPEQFLFPRINK